jgi:hypothetical protein
MTISSVIKVGDRDPGAAAAAVKVPRTSMTK